MIAGEIIRIIYNYFLSHFKGYNVEMDDIFTKMIDTFEPSEVFKTKTDYKESYHLEYGHYYFTVNHNLYNDSWSCTIHYQKNDFIILKSFIKNSHENRYFRPHGFMSDRLLEKIITKTLK